jgi:spoIIIJ-associated protein
MTEIEISARTVEEATGIALDELGLTDNQVEVTVLNAGKSGVFGIGGENATVRVTALEETRGPQPGNEADPEETFDDEDNDDQPPRDNEAVGVTRGIIEDLLDNMDLDGEVVCLNPDDAEALNFDIQGDDLGILIGRRGLTLAALQYLVRLMVSHQLKTRLPIYIDVESYRERRNEKLEMLAQRLASQVKSRRETFTMRPMSAYERRVIHMTLAEQSGVVTQSIGTGEGRRVVISPDR